MDKTGPAAGILAALALMAYVSTTGWFVDLFLPEPEIVAVDSDILAAHFGLSHPCMATVSQGMTSVTMSEPRCVTVRGAK